MSGNSFLVSPLLRSFISSKWTVISGRPCDRAVETGKHILLISALTSHNNSVPTASSQDTSWTQQESGACETVPSKIKCHFHQGQKF